MPGLIKSIKADMLRHNKSPQRMKLTNPMLLAAYNLCIGIIYVRFSFKCTQRFLTIVRFTKFPKNTGFMYLCLSIPATDD